MPDPLKDGHDLIVDTTPQLGASQTPLASWYAQGPSDALGDRLLMFDNSGAPAWEILRFRAEFTATPRFEHALRARVERLREFQHPCFPTVRAVDLVDDRLALVSRYVPGRRLSEVLDRARGPASAAQLIYQLTPALTMLHQHGAGLAHGALTADRIVMTPEGRWLIVEHAVGSALESLQLSASRLWTELGIVVHPTRHYVPKLDSRTDVIQLALVALSLVVGRRITPDDYPQRVGELLDRFDFAVSPESATAFTHLRVWLERALQLDDHAFQSARDARDALGGLMHYCQAQAGDECRTLLPKQGVTGEAAADSQTGDYGAVRWHWRTQLPQAPAGAFSGTAGAARPRISGALATAPEQIEARIGPLALLTAALGILTIGEGVLIGVLIGAPTAGVSALPPPPAVVVAPTPPPPDVWVNSQSADTIPLELTLGPKTRPTRVMTRHARVLSSKAPESIVDTLAGHGPEAVPSLQRWGELALMSSIELHVLEGERLLASSARMPIVMAPGHHELELVNSAVGYRSRRSIEIEPGKVLRLTVSPPPGRVNLNALPWAQVWIDDELVGETPLGNLSLALGVHELVFRHPELGERRATTVVRADVLNRVSVDLRQ
jgi:hypothetical protein